MKVICWAMRHGAPEPQKMTVDMSEASHAPCLTGRRLVAFSSTRVVPLVKTGKTRRYSRAVSACSSGQMTLPLVFSAFSSKSQLPRALIPV